MTIHIHELSGCAPAPLAHYLKALGILRLVAEQADPEARGWWEGERFRLATKLSRQELELFFLEQYQPTPLFNPWGGRSGFYSDSSEKSARTVLQTIEKSSLERFKPFQEMAKIVRQTISATTAGNKPKDEDKDRLILAIRNMARGKSLLWMDTVTAVMGSGEEIAVEQPALLGTGGNEGSGSYTSAYMSAIDQCLIPFEDKKGNAETSKKAKWSLALDAVLFGENYNPGCIWEQSMGQFSPGGSTTPWDFLLAFEGACMVRSAVSSRNSTESVKWMSSPFYVAPNSYGYASEGRLDEYALKNGKELPGRGEQWFPMWSNPMLCDEISQVFIQGRAMTKRGRATDGWSMVRAITSMGVQRGITEFVRYGYQQRNNLATHFAVPLGRFRVPDRVFPTLSCLDDLDAWLPRLRRQVRGKEAPARLRQAERHLADALFTVAQHPAEPDRWQTVLLGLAEVEGIMATGSGFKAGPVPRLRPEWVAAADDGSAGFRLAVTCALQSPADPIRRHWLPLAKNGGFATSGTPPRLLVGPEVVLHGRQGLNDAIALVERRLIEAGQGGERRLPLTPARRAAALPADLAALVAEEIDLDRTMALARALVALDRRAWQRKEATGHAPGAGGANSYPDDAWLAIRLALLPWPLADGRKIGADPAIVRRLASGDGAAAVQLALRRLRAVGIGAAVRVSAVTPGQARLWAAALVFPIDQPTAAAFVRRLDPNAM